MLEWTASDGDGDSLVYTVLYSGDGGTNWRVIASGLRQESYDLPHSLIAGGPDCRFRVIASDGFHSDMDESGPFSVPNHAPVVVVVTPPVNYGLSHGQTAFVKAKALDLEEGLLPDSSLVWISNLDGMIGLGGQLEVLADSLTEGVHHVTIQATDRGGLTGTKVVTLLVGGDLVVAVEQPNALPRSLELAPGAPNPFGATTRIEYALPGAARVSLTVYDLQGRQVARLADGEQPAGRHAVEWKGRDREGRRLGAGVYFVRLTVANANGRELRVRKIVMAK